MVTKYLWKVVYLEIMTYSQNSHNCNILQNVYKFFICPVQLNLYTTLNKGSTEICPLYTSAYT